MGNELANERRGAGFILLVIAVAVAGCQPATPSPQAATSPSPKSSGPQIWFAPFPPNHSLGGTEAPPRLGSVDYDDLFNPRAAWSQAARRVQVFKLYAPFLEGAASDNELRSLFRDLNRRGIAVAWEAGPLTPGPGGGASDLTGNCGRGVEGFGGEVNLTTARRIKALGGKLSFVALDGPFGNGINYNGPNACHWSAEKVAHQIVDSTRSLRQIFPNVVVGDIESDHQTSVAELETWMEIYRSVSGDYFPFFHLDVDWQAADWPQRASMLEAYLRQRGIRFGMIYNGGFEADTADLTWLASAQDHMAIYEMQHKGRPDDVVFQSWNDYPHHVLPETDPTAFTHLINRYFDIRTTLQLAIGAAPNGASQVTAQLNDRAGNPLVAAPIAFSLTPIEGRGMYSEYTLTGTVPAGITVAGIQIDLEDWAGGKGPINVDLYQVTYRQSGDTRQRVPNGNFAQGLINWGISPAAARVVSLRPSDRGGRMLHILAGGPIAHAYANSLGFSVIPGSTYTVTFAARVAPASRASGQFVLILGAPEQSRRSIAFAPATVTHSSATDVSGSTSWDLGGLSSSGVDIQGAYAGDDRHWPAFADMSAP